MTRITLVQSPSQLTQLAEDILSSEDVSKLATTIRLKLFAPLLDEAMLEACTPNDPVMTDNNGRPIHERYLKLSPLTKAWRQAWSKFPADTPRNFIFDLTPLEGILHQSEAKPGDLALLPNDISHFVCGIVTVMAIRSKRSAKFSLEAGGLSRIRSPRQMEKALEDLSRAE